MAVAMTVSAPTTMAAAAAAFLVVDRVFSCTSGKWTRVYFGSESRFLFWDETRNFAS